MPSFNGEQGPTSLLFPRRTHALCYASTKELSSFTEQATEALGVMTQNAQQLQGSELCGRRALLEDGRCGTSYQAVDSRNTREADSQGSRKSEKDF